jgi:hypothetical protein
MPLSETIFSSSAAKNISRFSFFSSFFFTERAYDFTPEKCAKRAFSRRLSGVHLNTAVIGLIVPEQDLHFPFGRVLGGRVVHHQSSALMARGQFPRG